MRFQEKPLDRVGIEYLLRGRLGHFGISCIVSMAADSFDHETEKFLEYLQGRLPLHFQVLSL